MMISSLRIYCQPPVINSSKVAHRLFHSSLIAGATANNGRVKSGFSHKKKNKDMSKKKHASHVQLRDWQNTVSHSNFSKNAPLVKIPTINPKALVPNTVVSFGPSIRPLTHFGAFKPNQRNELFRDRPSLVRQSTTLKVYNDFIKKGINTPSSENRVCIWGDQGVGKSVLSSQTQSLAFLSGYIVLHFSKAEDLLTGFSDYAYDETKNIYYQPMFLNRWLRKIVAGNKTILQSIKLSQPYSIKVSGASSLLTFTKNDSLYKLFSDPKGKTYRREAFEIFWKELLIQDQYPVLLSVDNFNAFMEYSYTMYRNTENKHIYFNKFELPKLIFKILSGKQSFKKGAVVVSTSSVFQSKHTLPVALGLEEFDPYFTKGQCDHKQVELLSGVRSLEVKRLSKEETATLISYCRSASVFSPRSEEQEGNLTVDHRYMLSGNGNPRELLNSFQFLY